MKRSPTGRARPRGLEPALLALALALAIAAPSIHDAHSSTTVTGTMTVLNTPPEAPDLQFDVKRGVPLDLAFSDLGVRDGNGDELTLTIHGSGEGASAPEGSAPFIFVIGLTLELYTVDLTAQTIKPLAPLGENTPDIRLFFSVGSVAGDYVVKYVVNDGTDPTEGTHQAEGTITFTLTDPVSRDITVSTLHNAPARLDFTGAIEAVYPDLTDITFTLDDLPNPDDPANPIPHNISFDNTSVIAQDQEDPNTYRTTGIHSHRFSSGLDQSRTVTGSYSGSDNFGNQYSGTITINILTNEPPTLDKLTYTLTVEEAKGRFLTVIDRAVLESIMDIPLLEPYSINIDFLNNPGSLGTNVYAIDDPTEQTSEILYDPAFRGGGTETVTYDINIAHGSIEDKLHRSYAVQGVMEFVVPLIPPTCSISIQDLYHFGDVAPGDTTNDVELQLQSSVDASSLAIMVHGGDWTGDNGTMMGVGQTAYSLARGQAHTEKTPLTDSPVQLITLPGTHSTTSLFMSAHVDLADPTYIGDLNQPVTVSYTCER